LNTVTLKEGFRLDIKSHSNQDLAVRGEVPGEPGYRYCICKCGKQFKVKAKDIASGKVTGCGCDEQIKKTKAAINAIEPQRCPECGKPLPLTGYTWAKNRKCDSCGVKYLQKSPLGAYDW